RDLLSPWRLVGNFKARSRRGALPHVDVALHLEMDPVGLLHSTRAEIGVAHAHIEYRGTGKARLEHGVEIAGARIPIRPHAGRSEPDERDVLLLVRLH